MSEGKRKRADDELSDQVIKVSHTASAEQWMPVLAFRPGLSSASPSSFRPFKRARTNNARANNGMPELLLHSADHPKLDYIAREEHSNDSSSHLKHYVGVYDPSSGKLKLVPARRLVVRSSVYTSNVEDDEPSQDGTALTNSLSARTNLGLAFGTKKAQKAIKNLTTNAIQVSPSKPRQEGSSSKRQLDPLSEAVISSMAAPTSSMPTREEMQAQTDEHMPRPKANLEASTLADVYTIESLVGGEHHLRTIAVKQWIDTIESQGDVPTQSLYVSRRIVKFVESGDVKRLKALKFLLLLLLWYRDLKTGTKGVKRVPKVEEMGSLIEVWGKDLVLGLARRFSEDNTLNRWHQHLVLTHILALALVIDNCVSDTNHIRLDLKIDSKEISKLYAELGCPLRLPTDAERAQLKITKADAGGHRFAQLRLPLVFPKSKLPMSKKR